MVMKALQVVKPREFKIIQAPVPVLKSGALDRILIRTGWVSMCGSDIPFFTGSKRYKNYPLNPGAPIHECYGQVIESTSARFQAGDWVVAIPEGDQGLAEFFIAQGAKAVRLPPELAACPTTCLMQPLSTVMKAINRLGDISGRSVAVVGLGSIGLFFCWLLEQGGAEPILGIDPNPERCRVAESWGASRTYALRSVEAVHAARQNPAEWDAPEIIIEAVGHQMDTLNDCIELVRKEGTVVAFGVPDQPVYPLEYENFFRKNAQMIASVTPEWSEYLSRARDLFLIHRSKLEMLVTHRFPIWEAGKAFTLYEQHADGILKALLDASCWEADCA